MVVAVLKKFGMKWMILKIRTETIVKENMETQFVQVTIKAIIEDGRLIQKYPTGEKNDQCCIHGIKLRWSCDECEEYICEYETPEPN